MGGSDANLECWSLVYDHCIPGALLFPALFPLPAVSHHSAWLFWLLLDRRDQTGPALICPRMLECCALSRAPCRPASNACCRLHQPQRHPQGHPVQ